MKRNALVTGAGGAIGSTLVRRLIEQGYGVRALFHSAPSSSEILSPAVKVIIGEVTDGALMREVVAETNLVFHLAAKLHVEDPPAHLAEEYFRVNVEGTRCLAEAAATASVERLIFFSTINVYGASAPGEVIADDAPLHPDSFYAETKVKAEEIVRTMPASVVLRVAAVYGSRMKGNFPRLVRAIKRGWPVLIGDGLNRRTMIYVEDLCRAAIVAAEHPAASDGNFNVTDGSVHSLREIVDAISISLGRAPSKLRLPEYAARGGVTVLEQAYRAAGKRPPISRSTIDKLTEDMAVSGDKMRMQLGFHPEYDLVSGWRETIRQIDSSS